MSGDYAAVAVNNLTASVTMSTRNIVDDIGLTEKKLSVLKSRYYDYALKKQIEISFGNVATTVFSEYRTRVENEFSKLSKEILLKLQAIEDKIGSDNPELYSQALTTCRRLLRKRPKNCLKNTFRDTKRKSIKQNLERKLTLVESTIKINFQR